MNEFLKHPEVSSLSFFKYLCSEFRLALVQLAVGASKADNLSRAARLIKEASKEGAKVVALPVSICYRRVIMIDQHV